LTLCALLTFASCCTVPDSVQYQQNVVVKRPLSRQLNGDETIAVQVRSAEGRTVVSADEIDHNLAFVEADLRTALRLLGFRPQFSSDRVQLRLECVVRRTLGRPQVGRNLYMHWSYKGVENIKLLEGTSDRVLGEVEYKRPRCSLPPNDLEKVLLERLLRLSLSSNASPARMALPNK
jgi:hypothetical protein